MVAFKLVFETDRNSFIHSTIDSDPHRVHTYLIVKFIYSEKATKIWRNRPQGFDVIGKFLSEALLFAEHGENMLCIEIVLNVEINFCTQHVLPMF